MSPCTFDAILGNTKSLYITSAFVLCSLAAFCSCYPLSFVHCMDPDGGEPSVPDNDKDAAVPPVIRRDREFIENNMTAFAVIGGKTLVAYDGVVECFGVGWIYRHTVDVGGLKHVVVVKFLQYALGCRMVTQDDQVYDLNSDLTVATRIIRQIFGLRDLREENRRFLEARTRVHPLMACTVINEIDHRSLYLEGVDFDDIISFASDSHYIIVVTHTEVIAYVISDIHDDPPRMCVKRCPGTHIFPKRKFTFSGYRASKLLAYCYQRDLAIFNVCDRDDVLLKVPMHALGEPHLFRCDSVPQFVWCTKDSLYTYNPEKKWISYWTEKTSMVSVSYVSMPANLLVGGAYHLAWISGGCDKLFVTSYRRDVTNEENWDDQPVYICTLNIDDNGSVSDSGHQIDQNILRIPNGITPIMPLNDGNHLLGMHKCPEREFQEAFVGKISESRIIAAKEFCPGDKWWRCIIGRNEFLFVLESGCIKRYEIRHNSIREAPSTMTRNFDDGNQQLVDHLKCFESDDYHCSMSHSGRYIFVRGMNRTSIIDLRYRTARFYKTYGKTRSMFVDAHGIIFSPVSMHNQFLVYGCEIRFLNQDAVLFHAAQFKTFRLFNDSSKCVFNDLGRTLYLFCSESEGFGIVRLPEFHTWNQGSHWFCTEGVREIIEVILALWSNKTHEGLSMLTFSQLSIVFTAFLYTFAIPVPYEPVSLMPSNQKNEER